MTPAGGAVDHGPHLAAIASVTAVAELVGVDLWLRGGWAMDLALGRVSRAHTDVDWFAWADDLPALTAALAERGWRPIGASPPQQQRDLARGDVELSIAALARSGDRVVVAGGPWLGEPWPARMLDDAIDGELEGIPCRAISVAAQLEIKLTMPDWIPGRLRRAKDALDVEVMLDELYGCRSC